MFSGSNAQTGWLKMEVTLNEQGGICSSKKPGERDRARHVDLGTLPWDLEGTNCGSCLFFEPSKSVEGITVGQCLHPEVSQPVTSRMCCAIWSHAAYLRSADC